ncbi:DJ-1 family glyoxalase III [Geobacter sp. AOG2]|uniref:DJ-1 family glyoxalase III n=1 Tax=Geobacter sp. AOG2 TaxID=1566347 RepID=UPI001CC34075|nr:DJ-1 family glyoxalase III [Geobacter sp. AOG2]GFE61281.1 hypothetical protein AOG2_18680 [Geobacter sp. AOG2]
MAKVLIPLADGFEELEAITVIDVLRRAGIEVITAGLHPGPVPSARKVAVIPDTTIDTARADDFDMIILPGGQPGSDNLNADIRIDKLLKDFSAADKLIGAICAAPTVLAAAGLLTGRQATSYPSYREKLGGAYYLDKTVVEDGKIITSQGPGTAIPFALAVVARLAGNHTAEDVARAMLVATAGNDGLWDQRLFNSIVQALVGALELKDSYTQGHAKRVTEYSLGIGSKLNFSEAKLRDLYLGAILHDIGKIGTEEEVLNKPERLNLREETLVREHPLKGTLFIVGVESLDNIVPTILHHHERWDGNGYPARLKGEQIPLHARIVCIADAFDAMLSVRSYRPAQDREAAIRELHNKKGTQFDPFLVDVFVEFLNESPFEIRDFSYYF